MGSSVFPSLRKMQREEGPSGRQKFEQGLRIVTVFFALGQGILQLYYIREFVTELNYAWLFENSLSLSTGALILTFLSNEIDALNLGNGTSILIFINILSFLSDSINTNPLKLVSETPEKNIVILGLFVTTILVTVYIQEAERKIPINYASQSIETSNAIENTSYLPFKVNATGVMPVIFASSFLALPASLTRFSDNDLIQRIAISLSYSSPFYAVYTVLFIFLINYSYTLLQLDPLEVADNLKKSGASISAVRPGKNTSDYLEKTLVRISFLGSTFLGFIALAPFVLETITGQTISRDFRGTSILIMVGVASEFARKLRAERLMTKYEKLNKYI